MNYKLNWGAPAGRDLRLADEHDDVQRGRRRCSTRRLRFLSPTTGPVIYIGGDGGYGWVASSGTLTTAAGDPCAIRLQRERTACRRLRRRPLSIQPIRASASEGDWQASNLIGNSQQQAPIGAFGGLTGRHRVPRRSVYGFHDDQRLRIDPRSVRLRF